uniref:Lipase domain-containing protein n=1 Tax=Timema shepardi TaxID=629360 RepID=A0A7R9B8B5_TIMSH|nr:unnamed protein product [Timema shepardi]
MHLLLLLASSVLPILSGIRSETVVSATRTGLSRVGVDSREGRYRPPLPMHVMGTRDTGIVHSAFGAQTTGLVHPGSRPKKAGFMGLTKKSREQKLESIKFLLYTNDTEAPLKIDVDRSLSAVDTKLDTKVLIHGWHGSPSNYKSIIAAYLARGNVNVIAVDWGSLSMNMDYSASKADTEVTGIRVAQLLDNLADKGLNLSRVNCVGHSLGGQTAGVVGDRVTKGVLGMITGEWENTEII